MKILINCFLSFIFIYLYLFSLDLENRQEQEKYSKNNVLVVANYKFNSLICIKFFVADKICVEDFNEKIYTN